jgi:hypothetical protein
MPEEFNLSKDVLDKAKTVDTSKSKKKSKTLRWVISGVLLVAIVGVFSFNIKNWFTPSNFNEDIPLSENISRWDALSWGAKGNFEGDNLDTKTGDWTLNTETGDFTSKEYDGCSMYFNRLTGDYGDFGNDKQDTEAYTKKFFEGKELSNSTAWVTLKGYDTRGIEVAKSKYIDEAGNYSMAYYRHSPLNKVVFFGVVRCADESTLEKIAPTDGDGSELADLGIWLKI